ncbi:hypothetical protein ACHAW6_008913 [Cyclotella cf. meneghiniana]
MIVSPTSNNNPASSKRGAFILLEGVDRCGKTTQVSLLVKHLLSLSLATVAYRFPDRTTQGHRLLIHCHVKIRTNNKFSFLLSVGSLINNYLTTNGPTGSVDDRAIHLLFSANRWESAPKLASTLASGTNIVCDRYAYSGVAFTSAKVEEDRSSMSGGELSLKWCMGPDCGLPAPDCVIFLDLDQEEAEKRGGYGGERYEKRDLQIRVRKRFAELQALDEKDGRVPWHIVDASQSIEDVTDELVRIVNETLERVDRESSPLKRMWEEGEYELPDLKAIEQSSSDAEEKKES